MKPGSPLSLGSRATTRRLRTLARQRVNGSQSLMHGYHQASASLRRGWAAQFACAAVRLCLLPAILAVIMGVWIGSFLPPLLLGTMAAREGAWSQAGFGVFSILAAVVSLVLAVSVTRWTQRSHHLAVPAALMLVAARAARQRFRQAYRIREFQMTADGQYECIPEGGLVDDALPAAPRPDYEVRQEEARETDERPPVADSETARAWIRSREFLPTADWNALGWIERRLGAVLSRRERDIVVLLYGGVPLWTVIAKRLILVTVVAGAVGAALLLAFPGFAKVIAFLVFVSLFRALRYVLIDPEPRLYCCSTAGQTSPVLVQRARMLTVDVGNTDRFHLVAAVTD